MVVIMQLAAFQGDRHLALDFVPVSTAVQPRKVIRSQAQLCPKIEVAKLRERRVLMSQYKEDEKLLNWFNGLCGGTYIELGGLTGKEFSNTYVFNKAFQWAGVLIEPSPVNFEKLTQNRPSQYELATVNAAVCKEEQDIHFYVKPGMGAVNGIWEFTDATRRLKAWPGATLADTTLLKCKPFMDILDDNLGYSDEHFFDILSLDIEGAELSALLSLDFDRVDFGVIVVENRIFHPRNYWAVRTLIESKGYIFIENEDKNDWFIHGQFYEIYEGLTADEA